MKFDLMDGSELHAQVGPKQAWLVVDKQTLKMSASTAEAVGQALAPKTMARYMRLRSQYLKLHTISVEISGVINAMCKACGASAPVPEEIRHTPRCVVMRVIGEDAPA
jgi:uncharacterized membrane protein